MSEILKTALQIGIPVVGIVVLVLIIRHGDLKRAREMVEKVRKNLSDYYTAKEEIAKEAEKKKDKIDAEPIEPFSPESARKHLEESKEWPPQD